MPSTSLIVKEWPGLQPYQLQALETGPQSQFCDIGSSNNMGMTGCESSVTQKKMT